MIYKKFHIYWTHKNMIHYFNGSFCSGLWCLIFFHEYLCQPTHKSIQTTNENTKYQNMNTALFETIAKLNCTCQWNELCHFNSIMEVTIWNQVQKLPTLSSSNERIFEKSLQSFHTICLVWAHNCWEILGYTPTLCNFF